MRLRPDQRVTVREFKRRPDLRRAAPSIDIQSINFAFGSAEVPYSQYGKVENIADGLRRVLRRNPRAKILIEGHTDAVGSDLSNLKLSDLRANTVARILSDFYDIPPENLVTQGYGERYLKINTQIAERENRRVTIRRITPLITPVANR